MSGPTRVVLVHGAWHRGSCWAPVTVELTARGYRVDAPDMPSDESGRGAQDYADAVLAAIGPGREPVVLVGHSLGGLTVPVAADRLGSGRVAAVVLVAAMTPVPGTSFIGRMSDEALMVPGYDRGVRRGDDGTTYWPADAAADGLYRGVADEIDGRGTADRGDPRRPGGEGGGADRSAAGDERLGASPGATAVAAATAGLRPQAWTIGKETTPLAAWPSTRTVSVVCAGDRVADPAACRRAAGPIGAEIVELGGGHFPMVTRPGELADVLARIAGSSS